MKKIACVLLLFCICFSLVACTRQNEECITQNEEYKIYLAYTENWKDTINNASLEHKIDYIVVEYREGSRQFDACYWFPRGVGKTDYNECSYTYSSTLKSNDLPANMAFDGDILQVTYTPHEIVSFSTLGYHIFAIILYCH